MFCIFCILYIYKYISICVQRYVRVQRESATRDPELALYAGEFPRAENAFGNAWTDLTYVFVSIRLNTTDRGDYDRHGGPFWESWGVSESLRRSCCAEICGTYGYIT